MKLSVALLPRLIRTDIDLSQCCAVVIDVLRATTVMAQAISSGAESIVTCSEVDEAKLESLASDIPALLCGERHCKMIEGFDCGNSPAEYTKDRTRKKRIVLTTTNGTAAIKSVTKSQQVLTAAFSNLSVTSSRLHQQDSVLLVCAGTNGEITYEDVLCAGAVASRLCDQSSDIELDDSAVIALPTWREFENSGLSLKKALSRSQGGRNLISVGYASDIELCAEIDSCNVLVERTSTTPNTFVSGGT